MIRYPGYFVLHFAATVYPKFACWLEDEESHVAQRYLS
jgi:hypothetical protein